MIELVYSNQTERLLEDLALNLQLEREAGAHPLAPVELVVPNRNMEAFVNLGLAQHLGVAANLHFRRLERFIGEIINEACPGKIRLAGLEAIEAAILSLLLNDQLLKEPAFKPVARYLSSSGGQIDLSQQPGTDHEKDQAKHASGENVLSSPGIPQSFDLQLAKDGADLRRVQLASQLAYLFQEYIYSRPEMIAFWRTGKSLAGDPLDDPAVADPTFASTAAWQHAIFKAVFGQEGFLAQNPPIEGGHWATLDELTFDDNLFKTIKENGLPNVYIFGMSYVARIFQHLFARLGQAGNLHIYTLNPCAEFWEDVETDRDLFRRLDKQKRSKRHHFSAGLSTDQEENMESENGTVDSLNEDPFGLNEADTPALRYWGRPGREHVRLLDELTDCDFKSAFADPLEPGNGLLHHLQRDILYREPEKDVRQNPEEIKEADDTIKLIAAPSVRREVEWVTDQIWRLMRDDDPAPGEEPLRFSDVAVIVNSNQKDIYLPQIETVFEACHNLPSSISDLPGTAGSRFIEAMSMLINLPFGKFSRAEVLTLVSHPAVIGSFEDLRPEDLAQIADSLGIMFGADHSDHRGTYIDEDVFNWDQGIRRLALGTLMSGEKSGDERIFETNRGRWLVKEVSGSQAESAARFGLLIRSLLADCRFVREEEMTPGKWAEFYRVQLDAYLFAQDQQDRQDRLRLLSALSKLETMDLGSKVSGRIAAEIALNAVESLGGGRGRYLAEGVVVSSFLPMRAIPFRVVFVLGLGEGLFPASEQRDALDLRAARRRAGDVDPAERDRYMFLETLLCAREKLYLSYVKRDGQTGDPLQPSAVVQELLHMLQTGYLGEQELEAIKIEPPLWRFDDITSFEDTFLDEAKTEAQIKSLSRELQERLPAEAIIDSAGKYAPIRSQLTPAAWEKLSAMLSLPGDPPEKTQVTATTGSAVPGEEESLETPLYLSIWAIRRFLECPMQGWASAVLGLSEEEEDLLEREEEDFDVGRPLESRFLQEVFLDAAAGGFDPGILYEEKAARMRLSGQFPVGVLGQVSAVRHKKILHEWQKRLASYLNNNGSEECSTTAGLPEPLHRVRLGRSNEQSVTEAVFDPLVLNLTLPGNNGHSSKVKLHIGGRTEGLTTDRSFSITFHPRTMSNWNQYGAGRNFRQLLRGLVDHLILSAIGLPRINQRSVLLCYAGDREEKGITGFKLRSLEQERAKAWLETIVSDLLTTPHTYLMPCEAVITEYFETNRELFKASKGGRAKKEKQKESPAADQGEEKALSYAPLNGAGLRDRISAMAEDENASFSSLWGPVPSPRSYQPPPADEAEQIAMRRFGPLFEDIIEVEEF
ncbi:MAG: exodeoxyribonuclease V subunit gamma [Bacillota bacterium]